MSMLRRLIWLLVGILAAIIMLMLLTTPTPDKGVASVLTWFGA